MTDDSFDPGRQLLRAVRLVSALRRETGVELAVSTLFDGPTIRDMARKVREAKESAGGPGSRAVVVPVRTCQGTLLVLPTRSAGRCCATPSCANYSETSSLRPAVAGLGLGLVTELSLALS
ncbi:acyl carrier protein [Streptomyces sp. NPDC087425]|uniref:acyl carrier protein n=1 Tax=Streptomyces sp. NPDC087425 TaxID=3365787 RepID=UPI003830532C